MSHGHQVRVTLFAWSYAEMYIYIYMYVHSQPLRIGTVELVDNSNSQSENVHIRLSDSLAEHINFCSGKCHKYSENVQCPTVISSPGL